MLTGKRFRMQTPTLAIDTVQGKRVAVHVDVGAVVKVVSGPTPGDRMLDVLMDGRVLTMFVLDVSERGEEISEKSAEV